MKRYAGWLAAVGLVLTSQAWGQECSLTIEGTDGMMFTKPELKVSSSCKEVKLTLKHTGTAAVTVMGHNWVLTKTADAKAIQDASNAVGPPKYLPTGDPRIIAATELIGGGQETSITFSMAGLEKGGDYTYFCSYPPHYLLMKGKFIVE